MRRSRGFTLLEVLVALAIVAFGIIAAFNAIIQMAHSTARLQDRAIADWIALNQISEIRLSGDFPEVSEFDGSVEFAGRNWRWEATVSETGVTDMRRIDMSVAPEENPDDVVTIVAGFVSRQAGPPLAVVDWWGAQAGGQDETPGDEDVPPDEEPSPEPPAEPGGEEPPPDEEEE